MIKARLGHRLDAWLEQAFPWLARCPVSPNTLTVFGSLISGGAALAFGMGALRTGGVLILAGGFFDLVDGVVARRLGRASTFGAFLDSTLDRLVDMGILFGILVHFARTEALGHLLLTGVALIASVLVSYAKSRAERYIPVFEGGILERGERLGLLAAGAILGFLVPALWVVAIGSCVTVVQRFTLAYREMERLDAAARASHVENPAK